ncbi:MarR family winged helix-turn-helix transcriptional regulator [Kitasatospora sp. NPDC004289]
MENAEGPADGPMDRLGFVLAWHGAATDTRIRRALSTSGLGPRHTMTLMHLGSAPVGQRQLAERLGVDPSVLVALLNDLEGAGLVERRRDPADRRRHIVEITPAGTTTLDHLDRTLTEVESTLFGDLSERERTTLRKLLGRINTSPGDHACEA